MEEFEVGGVGPAEADDVDVVATGDGGVGGAGHAVIFFDDVAFLGVIFRDGAGEFVGDAAGVFSETVAAQAFDENHLRGRPGIREIPLRASVVGTHDRAAELLESFEVGENGFGLLGSGKSGPEWIVRGDVFVSRLFVFGEIVIEEFPFGFVPKIFVDGGAS